MATSTKNATRIYLISAQGDTGESFDTQEQLHSFYYDACGEWPSFKTKQAMRSGFYFSIGSREYRTEKRKTNNINAA